MYFGVEDVLHLVFLQLGFGGGGGGGNVTFDAQMIFVHCLVKLMLEMSYVFDRNKYGAVACYVHVAVERNGYFCLLPILFFFCSFRICSD